MRAARRLFSSSLAVPLAVLLAGQAAAAPPAQTAGDITPADKVFIDRISSDALFEIRAGQLASDRAVAPDIRDMGSMIAHDHGLANQRLRVLVVPAGLDLAREIDPDDAKALDALNALSGPAFDQAWLGDIQRIEARDAILLATESRSGGTEELRDYAGQTHRIVLRQLGALHAVGPVSN